MQNVSLSLFIYIYIYTYIYKDMCIQLCINIYLQDTSNCLDHMYNYVYVIEQNNAKTNMMEQNPFIGNILRFYRSYKIMNTIMEQFSHISLQFVANVYKDNMINE